MRKRKRTTQETLVVASILPKPHQRFRYSKTPKVIFIGSASNRGAKMKMKSKIRTRTCWHRSLVCRPGNVKCIKLICAICKTQVINCNDGNHLRRNCRQELVFTFHLFFSIDKGNKQQLFIIASIFTVGQC